MRVRAWRIKALFSRVAGNQQELDMQRLLAGLEIWGPYYHCLSCGRDLHGGKEYPLAPYTPWHIRPQPSHLLLTHIPHILSILACPCSSLGLCFDPTLADVSLHITNKSSKCASVSVPYSGNVLISTGKGVNVLLYVLTNITYINVNWSHTIWLFLLRDQVSLHLWHVQESIFLSRQPWKHLTARGNREKLHLHTCSCQNFPLMLMLGFSENAHTRTLNIHTVLLQQSGCSWYACKRVRPHLNTTRTACCFSSVLTHTHIHTHLFIVGTRTWAFKR